jgi:hypothetical protein
VSKLTVIDDLLRRDHYYLTADDEVAFFGEYTARKGYAHSDTNQLIINLKKKPNKRGLPEWKYKEQAIQRASDIIRGGFDLNKLLADGVVIVPMPPSKARGHPLHDDRMLRVALGVHPALQVRELLRCKLSMDASHESDVRPKPPELAANMEIDEGKADPPPTTILLLDDVLTTGAHFVAAKQVLRGRFPAADVLGVFVARRLPETDLFMDIDDVLGPITKLDIPKPNH